MHGGGYLGGCLTGTASLVPRQRSGVHHGAGRGLGAPLGGSGGMGWAPTDTGTSPKLGVMEVGGVTRSEGESNKNAVMFAHGLGLQKPLNNNRFLSLHAGGVWWGYSFLKDPSEKPCPASR